MSNFKHQWNIAMALQVLENPMVDSATWSEAVKWLLLHGPPEIQALISQASRFATSEHFPELHADHCDAEGFPCYDLGDLAKALGISEEELAEQLADLEDDTGRPQFLDRDDAHKIH